jgi:WSTF, HB1, Itc1p, MBD9 motif 1
MRVAHAAACLQYAAAALGYSDYGDLSVGQRLTVLRALVTLGLLSEALREHVAERADAVSGSKRRGKAAVRPCLLSELHKGWVRCCWLLKLSHDGRAGRDVTGCFDVLACTWRNEFCCRCTNRRPTKGLCSCWLLLLRTVCGRLGCFWPQAVAVGSAAVVTLCCACTGAPSIRKRS